MEKKDDTTPSFFYSIFPKIKCLRLVKNVWNETLAMVSNIRRKLNVDPLGKPGNEIRTSRVTEHLNTTQLRHPLQSTLSQLQSERTNSNNFSLYFMPFTLCQGYHRNSNDYFSKTDLKQKFVFIIVCWNWKGPKTSSNLLQMIIIIIELYTRSTVWFLLKITICILLIF